MRLGFVFGSALLALSLASTVSAQKRDSVKTKTPATKKVAELFKDKDGNSISSVMDADEEVAQDDADEAKPADETRLIRTELKSQCPVLFDAAAHALADANKKRRTPFDDDFQLKFWKYVRSLSKEKGGCT